jgi:hypothetical protein
MNQPPAVIVNGEGLTRAEFEHLVEAGRRMPTSATSAAVDPDAVVDVVNEVLAAQDAAVRGYRLTDAQFDSAVRNIRERNRISTDDQFEAALTQQGLTRSGFRRSLERQLQFSRLRFQVEGGASIRDQDRVWDDYLRSLRSRAEVEWSDSQMEEAYKVGVARRQQ